MDNNTVQKIIHSIVTKGNTDFFISCNYFPELDKRHAIVKIINLIISNTLDKFNIRYKLFNCCSLGLRGYDERIIDSILWKNRRFMNMVYNSIDRLCSTCKKFAIIPILLRSKVMNGHMIVAIYIKTENIFYIFDSSGSSVEYEHLHDLLKDFFGDYKYIKKCHHLQDIEGSVPSLPGEINGYCVSWSCYFITCYMKLHKIMSMNDIVQNTLDCANTPMKLRQLIRRFSLLCLEHNI
jgi:hypothetical protein